MKRIAFWLAAGLMLHGCASRPLTLDAPQSSSVVRKQMLDAIESGDRATLTRSAIDLAGMGASLSDASIDRIAPLLDLSLLADVANQPRTGFPDGVTALRTWFRDNGKVHAPRPEELVATVPAEYRLVEGIAWDPARKRLFIGTVVDGRLAYLEDGVWHEVPVGSPRGGLFGMAVDAKRGLLWIATGSVDQTAVTGERMTGLIAVDLDTLKVVRRVALSGNAPGVAGDVALAPDGTVFVSNSMSGAIHRCRPGCAALDDLVPAGRFRSPQGMALSKRGGRLYVADYGTGLWVVETRTGQVSPMRVAQATMLDGVDGLVAAHRALPAGEGLVAIQNGTRPRRIIRLHPGRSADIVRHAVPLLALSPDGPEPTLGVLVGDSLYYIGDGQWERYGPGGALKDGQPPRGTPILQLPVMDIGI
ncbi:hypothetical protein [Sphingomonas sp. G-3-2-10]|uniref:SMP-30/gluconolactonase/LRE family protein n=1 Tax=Sphingomonas sp. G-3-2-10 TaxID=2728838 RepID=UPI00146D07CF|nr:hypothetical protein [Sphingomonas sp. G-3-2-10]NML05052.1 hypothetical protein [Sphingomonas sp. G-3-2-10]